MVNPGFLDSLASYPRWMVISVAIVGVALAVWILAKLLKWILWIALIAVLLVGGFLLFESFTR